jgi:predicted nucleotidyltransferase component of viral defense system
VSKRDVGASIRQRLLNQARAKNRPFQELLQYFAMERFLYRLAESQFADRFILKGALLLAAWRLPFPRPTMDIDLAGRTSNELDHIVELVGRVCEHPVESDGIDFSRSSIQVSRIKEEADYHGVRVQFHGTLAKARIPMQLDIGFGDIITPGPMEIAFPTLLDFPPPILRGYPKETVIAEKLEALTTLGLLNSRIKDYYDLALLSRVYPFDGHDLADAVIATFHHRGTPIDAEPIGLTEAYYLEPARTVQWRAFVRRSRFEEESGDLAGLVTDIRLFAMPLLSALAAKRDFQSRWDAGGPWK